MEERKSKFVIIDGNAIIHRAWHALPQNLMTSKGKIINAVFGFTSILLKALKDLKPDYIAATFDLKGPTFRHKEYKEYKATREKQPDELYKQIPAIKEVVEAFNIPIYEKQGYEADDVIATIVAKIRNSKFEIRNIIVTGDMDTFQLIDENTEVFSMHKGVSDTITYDIEQIKKRFGDLKPGQLIDFKALRGDPSDNIPGVKGIGEKTAIELLKNFGTLEKIYKHVTSKKIKPRYQKLLLEQKENAFLSKHLVILKKDVPIDFNLKQCQTTPPNLDRIVPIFQKLEFKSLLSRLAGLSQKSHDTPNDTPTRTSTQNFEQASLSLKTSQPDKPRVVQEGKVQYHCISDDKEFFSFLKKLKGQKYFALDTETTSFHPLESKLVGVGISWEESIAYFIPNNKTYLKELKPIFEDENIKKIGQNIKFDIESLRTEGIFVRGELFDTMVAAYLNNPGSRQHSLDTLAFTEFGYQMQGIESLIGKRGKNQLSMDQVPIERVSDYCCEDVDFTLRLVKVLTRQLETTNNLGLFKKIEMPLIYVLVEMEKNGVLINTGFLKKMSLEFGLKIKKLQDKIYKLSKTRFNIASPIQLKGVLFDKLKLATEGIHRTKTGISSAAAELEKLKDQHPVIPRIMEFRELSKLKSTYIDALPALQSAKDSRVHTSYNQTITATGRLSSSEPNLQNIPIRTDLGQKIRKAFIAEKGGLLLAADYSQIELRVIASLAEDEKMLEGFNKHEDIHTRTAAEIAGVSQNQVTPKMRRAAKTINFGIIYGMGPYGLAMREGISSQKAREFIDKYFTLHKNIKMYLDKTKEVAKKFGYVETLFGRRRYVPEINSSIQTISAQAERMAVNHPVQGTAADLMKLAMIDIHKELPGISKDTRLILQVHDELVFEVPKNEIRKVGQFVKSTMENVYKLRSPIEVKLEAGKNWGEMSLLLI